MANIMNLGDRIKRYESVTNFEATGRVPLMIRVDGRAFHTFTRGMDRPFDQEMMDAMVYGAIKVAREMQGFKAAYIQSDEATFCITDYDRVTTQGWFDYDISKIVSLTSSLMSVHFNDAIQSNTLAVFDSRAFSVPQNDVVNAFLWRAKDWERNSLQMYARAHFSHKDLHGKGRSDMHEMLHEKGLNWATDLSPQQRNGTFLIAKNDGIDDTSDILPSYEDINREIGHLFRYPE